MVPTLSGRVQTRLVLLLFVGGVVSAAIAPLLPVTASAGERYRAVYLVLAAVAVLGVGWELVYHLLMQWRWEKDWPTLFGLLTAIPEGVVIWLLNQEGLIPGLATPLPLDGFVINFAAVWLAVWVIANGPLRVPFIRWRFRGGRFV